MKIKIIKTIIKQCEDFTAICELKDGYNVEVLFGIYETAIYHEDDCKKLGLEGPKGRLVLSPITKESFDNAAILLSGRLTYRGLWDDFLFFWQ